MRIDAHHHLWEYNSAEYGWIGDEMRVLRRNFLPSDLHPELKALDIAGTVVVQARQTLAETVWLLDLADEYSWIRGVVGWVSLRDDGLPEILDRLASQPKLKGLRHVVQDEPEPEFMLQPDFLRGVAALERTGLVYDILVFERHLETTLRFVDRFPNQRFVLDHVGKPRVREGLLDPWRANMKDLARRPNVYCKLSGIASEAEWHSWNEETIRPYLEVSLEAFGPERLMFGSDWPVCLVATSYRRWFETIERFTSRLSVGERERILGGTASEAYSL